MIFILLNFLSLLRGPLALLFIMNSTLCRSLAVALAMLTDYLDGYLARRYQATSQIGAVLDALMDKFFVFVAMSVFILEGNLQLWQAFALISRDFAVLFFALYIAVTGTNFKVRAIWSGKVSTTLQFFVLLGLIFHLNIPTYIFWCFISLGFLALCELYFIKKQFDETLTIDS